MIGKLSVENTFAELFLKASVVRNVSTTIIKENKKLPFSSARANYIL